jgi:hypothetical protein
MCDGFLKNFTWLCTHLVVQAEVEFKFKLDSIHMLNKSVFTKFTYIQPWNMTFEDFYEDYWTIEASTKIRINSSLQKTCNIK